MALVLKALDQTGGERTVESGTTFVMGRGTDNDWVLPDPGREISKTHCRIESDGTGFVLVDLSINGVVIDGQGAPMGPGSRHRLASGDVFAVGQHRFAVSVGSSEAFATLPIHGNPPSGIGRILDGQSEGSEARASGATSGEAEAWLTTLPKGSAEQSMHQSLGWDAPPSTGDMLLPMDIEPISDFASRSEHTPATHGAMHLPQPQQLIPVDWLDDPPLEPAPAAPAPGRAQASNVAASDARQVLAEGARLATTDIASLRDDALFRRCGESLRALLDGLDTIEAAQAVAERDCGLPTPSDTGGLWTDFFANNRDSLLTLLVEQQPGPAQMLAQRIAALADRQRALGHAVADAAARYDARLSPTPLVEETKSRFLVGPLAKAAAWDRFIALHAELAAQGQSQEQADGEARPLSGFLVLLRKSFARAMTKRA